MAQRRIPEENRADTAILIRVSKTFKARLDRMANATGTGISETARTLLTAEVNDWEAANPEIVAADPLPSKTGTTAL